MRTGYRMMFWLLMVYVLKILFRNFLGNAASGFRNVSSEVVADDRVVYDIIRDVKGKTIFYLQ